MSPAHFCWWLCCCWNKTERNGPSASLCLGNLWWVHFFPCDGQRCHVLSWSINPLESLIEQSHMVFVGILLSSISCSFPLFVWHNGYGLHGESSWKPTCPWLKLCEPDQSDKLSISVLAEAELLYDRHSSCFGTPYIESQQFVCNPSCHIWSAIPSVESFSSRESSSQLIYSFSHLAFPFCSSTLSTAWLLWYSA